MVKGQTSSKDIVISERDQPLVEDYHSSSSDFDSRNPLINLFSSASEGPSTEPGKLFLQFSSLCLNSSKNSQENHNLENTSLVNHILEPQIFFTPHQFVSPPRSPPPNNMAQPRPPFFVNTFGPINFKRMDGYPNVVPQDVRNRLPKFQGNNAITSD